MRKKNRLPKPEYLGARAYFVTICCDQRFAFFRDEERAKRLVTLVGEVCASQAFRTYAYCVMPDHVHLLCSGTEAGCNLIELVRVLKLRSAFEEKSKSGRVLWQRSFYDHILRPDDAGDAVAWYIWMNPVRKNLCAEPRDYRFSGSFVIDWERFKPPATPWTPPWKAVAADL